MIWYGGDLPAKAVPGCMSVVRNRKAQCLESVKQNLLCVFCCIFGGRIKAVMGGFLNVLEPAIPPPIKQITFLEGRA